MPSGPLRLGAPRFALRDSRRLLAQGADEFICT
jgi:hypothetical protein